MKVYKLSNKTFLVRHWAKWYRVQRGGTDWHELKVQPRPNPFDVRKVKISLEKEYGRSKLPAIFDELEADKEVAKNLKKARKHPIT